MIEALWSVEFRSNAPAVNNAGSGIVVLETGRAFGGDSTYFYVGDYHLAGRAFTAGLTVTHYAGQLNAIFGPLRSFRLVVNGQLPPLTGQIGADTFVATGHLEGNPNARIDIRFVRRAELP
ncbi:MAG: hypothetical protein ISP90_18395 [Nevskia sp.]|nr:hypothetical protein [Nevskia sp.]